ncbi:MAG: hypothetical protein WAK91_00310 [Candidatus Acidiferrales bacterium]|jgi:hypothetical protein
MKRLSLFGALLSFFLVLTPLAHAQSTEVLQGTQIHITLLNGLSTTVAHNGDPFTAVVSEPVFYNGLMVLPAGAKIHGQVGTISRPKHFAVIRGEASMSLTFRSIEIESRIYPAQMSILAISNGGADMGKSRKDLHTVEGVVIEEKRDIKGTVEDVAIGTGGGSIVGAVFSHVIRGTVFGLVGSTAYVVQKKGKDVELPAQTQFLVRMDSSVSVPNNIIHSASTSTGSM